MGALPGAQFSVLPASFESDEVFYLEPLFGAAIVAEGIASRPADVDEVYLNSYDFPKWRGGPMFKEARTLAVSLN